MSAQRGFSIISAVFILVVLALLGAVMVTLSATQHQGLALSLETSRAVAAARSGVEWGGYQAINTGACPGDAFTLDEAALEGFEVSVSCNSSSHNERGSTISIYEIDAVAEKGAPGNPDYVRRAFRATFVDEGS